LANAVALKIFPAGSGEVFAEGAKRGASRPAVNREAIAASHATGRRKHRQGSVCRPNQDHAMSLRAALNRWFLARYVLRKWRVRRYAALPREEAFSEIYTDNRWGSSESRSGPGSELAQTLTIRQKLPALLERLHVRTFLDASCGDFHWMSEVDLGAIGYIGVDIVPKVIAGNREQYARSGREFLCGDIVTAELPPADLVLCRDCLMHLSFAEIRTALENLVRTGAQHLLLTTFPGTTRNADIGHGGWWPMNLQRPPFELPAPLELWPEDPPDAEARELRKSLGLWTREMIVHAGRK
jgi:SAM-dependent methyltransferase